MPNTTTQTVKLVRRLSTGKNLTVAEAKGKYGIARLAARIHELREAGFPIFTNKVTVKGGVNKGRRVTAYRLHVSATPKSLLNSFDA
jgi:putative ubiquitin-RnfH superfamily antitoxin RatB of RatAB toxin-antitoxin module